MNSRTLAILGILTLVVGALAYWSLRTPGADTPRSAVAGGSTSTAFLPGLTAKANDVASMTIKGSGKEAVVKKVGEGWVLENRGGYPVELSKVRDAVQSVSELVVYETKTAEKANYAYLGVDDPADAPASTARLVTLVDSGNKVLASFIVGNSLASPGNAVGSTTTYSVFVRRSGESQSYNVKGRLDPRTALDPDPLAWLKRDVLNVDQQRVKSVTITQPDGSRVNIVKDKKDDRDYKVANIPTGRELKFGGAGAQVAGAIASVNFDDVAAVSQVAEGATPTGAAEYRTFDGLVVTVDTSTKNGIPWATFTARYEAPPQEPANSDQTSPPPAVKPEAEVKKEVQELNDRLTNWAFSLPSFKSKQIVSTLEDLLKPADQTPVKIDQGAADRKQPERPTGDPLPVEK